MEKIFEEQLYMEGNRYYINIPFNVWELTNKKGRIPVEVKIQNLSFETKLILKGEGRYILQVNKKDALQLSLNESLFVELNFIEELTRINQNSPYDKEHPIRLIDSITFQNNQKMACACKVFLL